MKFDVNFVLKWTACAVTLAGALCTALRIDPINIYLLNAGSFLYLVWSIRIRELNLIVINAALLLIYVVGMFYTLPDPEMVHQSGIDREIECRRLLNLED